jgi:hypothetical protein
MVELDSYSSVDWSDSGINRDKAQALRSNSPEGKPFARLAATFIVNAASATWWHLCNAWHACAAGHYVDVALPARDCCSIKDCLAATRLAVARYMLNTDSPTANS